MSVINGSFSKPQRSSSVSRSRRATLSVGLPGPLPSNGSLSPQRALRARVLRERERSGVGNAQTSDAGGNAKAQEQAKAPSKGPTRSQQMQFAFGSKISKPISSRPGMSVGVGAVAPTRARTTTAAAAAAAASTVHGAVGADAGNVAGRSRRERTSRHEPQEHEQQQQQQQTQQGQRASSRGRGRTRSELQQRNPQPLVATTRQAASVAAYQVELEEKDALIADLRRRLEDQSTEAHQEESGGVKPAGTQRSSSDTSNTPKASLEELNEGELAALRAVEEEARADAEEKLAHVEAVAAAALSRAEEMQGRLNTMILSLKTRRKL
ncbi:unnamed protein product [Scytosiphon promiscuus]